MSEIQNLKFKIQNSPGFTLVELLVAIAVIVTSATLVFAIITATFRTSSKTASADQVRLAGDSAISQLTKLIAYADGFEGVVSDGTNITTCDSAPELYDSLKVLVDAQTKTITCLSGDANELSLDGTSIINASKFSLTNCVLKCSQVDSTSTPVININFDLSLISNKGVEVGSRVSFSRTIKMRNLNQ